MEMSFVEHGLMVLPHRPAAAHDSGSESETDSPVKCGLLAAEQCVFSLPEVENAMEIAAEHASSQAFDGSLKRYGKRRTNASGEVATRVRVQQGTSSQQSHCTPCGSCSAVGFLFDEANQGLLQLTPANKKAIKARILSKAYKFRRAKSGVAYTHPLGETTWKVSLSLCVCIVMWLRTEWLRTVLRWAQGEDEEGKIETRTHDFSNRVDHFSCAREHTQKNHELFLNEDTKAGVTFDYPYERDTLKDVTLDMCRRARAEGCQLQGWRIVDCLTDLDTGCATLRGATS